MREAIRVLMTPPSPHRRASSGWWWTLTLVACFAPSTAVGCRSLTKSSSDRAVSAGSAAVSVSSAPLPSARPAPPRVPDEAEGHDRAAESARALRLAAHGHTDVLLFTVGDRTFIGASDQLFATSEHGVVRDASLSRGIILPTQHVSERVTTMFGVWPQDAWLHVTTLSDDGTAEDYFYEYSTFHWMRDGWVKQDLVEEGKSRLVGGAPWGHKGTLIATSHFKEIRLRLGSGEPLAFQPTRTPWAGAESDSAVDAGLVTPPPPDVDRECITEVNTFKDISDANQLLAFPSGHAFLAGWSCRDGERSWLIERFAGNRSVGLDRLPKLGKTAAPIQLAGSDPEEVYMAVSPRTLQRFDGKHWQLETLPGTDDLRALRVSAQGTVWLLLWDGVLYRRLRGGSWTRFPLPKTYATSDEGKPMRVTDLSVPSDDHLWLTDQAGEVYTVGNVEEVVRLP
jgi:hypothetical protein